jgi:hypothetical protein
MEYISVKECPVCGAHPERDKADMGRPGGHGYPGNYSYQYKCEKCKLLKGESYTDIYCSPNEAVNHAKQSWNIECDRVLKLMRNK